MMKMRENATLHFSYWVENVLFCNIWKWKFVQIIHLIVPFINLFYFKYKIINNQKYYTLLDEDENNMESKKERKTVIDAHASENIKK